MNYLSTLQVIQLTWAGDYSFLTKCDFTRWLMRHADFSMTLAEFKETLEAIVRELA